MSEKGKRTATKDKGVYTLSSTVKKHNGKPDVCFYITYKDEARKVWERVGWRSDGYTQAYAVEQRAKRMHEKSTGTPVDAKTRKITFGTAYAEWATTHLPNLAEKPSIEFWAKEYVLPAIGKRPMAAITPLDLEKLKMHLGKKGLSAQTIKHILGLIRRVYNKAIKWSMYFGAVPTTAVTMPKPDAARLRYLTKQEASELLAKLEGTSILWHDITLLGLYTGMRFKDILRLRVRQVDIVSGFIDVIESKPGTYTAYFPENVRVMLLGRMNKDRNALIFPSPITDGVLYNTGKPFRKAIDECKFNDGVTDDRYKVVFHTLRHTFASWLAQEGVSITIIAELMGHATVRMTQRYAKLSPDSKKDAIQKIMHHALEQNSDSET